MTSWTTQTVWCFKLHVQKSAPWPKCLNYCKPSHSSVASRFHHTCTKLTSLSGTVEKFISCFLSNFPSRSPRVPGVVRGDGVGVQPLFGQMSGQVPDELGVAFTRFVQLGALAQGLVVCGEGHRLRLLHLKPVHCHLENDRFTVKRVSD